MIEYMWGMPPITKNGRKTANAAREKESGTHNKNAANGAGRFKSELRDFELLAHATGAGRSKS